MSPVMRIKLPQGAIGAQVDRAAASMAKRGPKRGRIRTDLVEVTVPDEPFFYLAGPMTGYPAFNYPRFEKVARRLRALGYVICTPHELENNLFYQEAVASSNGEEVHLASTGEEGKELLRRDVNIVMHPNCIGLIVLEGWEDSHGALIETFIGSRWGRQMFLYTEDSTFGVLLKAFDRDATLSGSNAGAVA